MTNEVDLVQRASCTNEKRVEDYFKSLDFRCERLDREAADREPKPDFRFSRAGHSFLCEVKTIFAVVGDEFVFRQTLHREFEEKFVHSPSQIRPYWLAISTERTKLPPKAARTGFWDWLEKTLLALDPLSVPIGRMLVFHYPWEPTALFDVDRQVTVWMRRKEKVGIPHPEILVGGAFGFADKIEAKIDEALPQLNQQAAREDDTRIPRLVVLATARTFEILDVLEVDNIMRILESRPGLSAVAILRCGLQQNLPFPTTREEQILIAQLYQTPGEYIDFFSVYHNTRVDINITSSLDRAVFDDQYSTQYPPLDTPTPW